MPPIYPGPVPLAAIGDSITFGQGSTSAIMQGGYRWLLQQACAAAGKPITWVGSQIGGIWANAQCEGYPGSDTDPIRISSQACRRWQQPEGLLVAPGTNNLGVGSLNQTPAQLLPLYTTFLNELWDTSAHSVPGGGNPLRFVIVSTLLKRSDDLVVTNPRVIDWNTNYLPQLVRGQVALGRDVSIIDGYSVVTGFSDNIHPNDAGYGQWMPAWLAGLTPKLRSS